MPTPAADRLRQVDKRAAGGATGQQRVFDYNAAGWLTAVQLPEYAGQEMRYAYDDLGNVTAKTLVSAMYGSLLGYAETLAYDALSRLTARTVKLLGTTTWHTFTYDGGAVAAPPAGHPGDFAWGRLTHDRTTYGLDPGAALAGADRGGDHCGDGENSLRGAPEVRPDISPACRGARPGLKGRPWPPESRPPTGGRAPERARGNPGTRVAPQRARGRLPKPGGSEQFVSRAPGSS
ncbi:MAG TPA: RHS repeat protein, partial [Kiritimatiellia bacterium]|nr:RHS repeat protein [Kiritimatiellia bacterium]